MKKSDKEILIRSNQERKDYKDNLREIKLKKKQEKHHQLILYRQKRAKSLDTNRYKEIINADCAELLKKINKHKGYVINILNNTDYNYASELIKLNFVHIHNKHNRKLSLTTTKLGEYVAKRLPSTHTFLKILNVICFIAAITFVVIGLTMKQSQLSILMVLCAGPSVSIFMIAWIGLVFEDTDISNNGLLQILKTTLNKKDYKMEYTILKKLARKPEKIPEV